MRYRDIASWTLFAMLGTPLLVLIGVVLALAVMTVTAHAECGRASFYGSESGARTASSERFNPRGLTIAMRSYHFGRRYRVTFGGRSVVVRHNDYGPAISSGRRWDLSWGAASRLRILKRGVATVCVTALE